jgi:purine-binding chemotaxis protein CheW
MKRAKIDWKAVQDRVRAGEGALEAALTPNPQRVEEAFRKRAVRLACVDMNRQPLSQGLAVLVFRLGQERYAIEIKELAEVLPFARCEPVPGASRRFLGVMNLRGELRAVLDLEHLLAPSNSRNDETGFVLMLRRSGKEIGLKVDHIEELREIRQEDLAPPPQGSYGKGLVGGSLTLLSVDAVLAAVFSREESRTA